MTYVAEDLGRQMRIRDGQFRWVYAFVLSCGCRVEVDADDVKLLPPFTDFGRARDEMFRTHVCGLALPQSSTKP